MQDQNYTPLDLHPINNNPNPQAENPDYKSEINYSNQNSQKKVKKIILIFAFLVFLLFTSSISVVVLAGYTNINIPGITPKVREKIRIMLAKTPIIPKTKDQVIAASISKAKTVTSFNVNSSGIIEAKTNPSTAVSLEFNSNNKLEYKEKKLLIQGEADAALNLIIDNFKFSFEYILIGSNLYFKVKSIPHEKILKYLKQSEPISPQEEQLIQTIVNKITNKWIFFGQSVLDTEAKKELEQESAKDQLKNIYHGNFDILKNSKLKNKINFVKKSNEYEFTVMLKGKEVIEILKDSILKEGKVLTEAQTKELNKMQDIIEKVTIRLIISKNYDLKKVAITASLNNKALNKDLYNNAYNQAYQPFLENDVKINISISSVFSEFNSSKNIQTPSSSISIMELLQELNLDLNNNYNLQRSQDNLYNNSSYSSNTYLQKLEMTQYLMQELSQYYTLNGKYPYSLDELFINTNSPNAAQAYQKLNISYIVSTNRDSYIIFFWNDATQKYTAYKNGKLISANLTSSELSEEINKIKQTVLGEFKYRFFDLFPSEKATPTP